MGDRFVYSFVDCEHASVLCLKRLLSIFHKLFFKMISAGCTNHISSWFILIVVLKPAKMLSIDIVVFSKLEFCRLFLAAFRS